MYKTYNYGNNKDKARKQQLINYLERQIIKNI